MPSKSGKDSKGCFWRWGSKTKYYYACGDKAASTRAKAKADKQGQAVYSTGWREDMRLQIPASKVKIGSRDSLSFRDVREEWPDPMAEVEEASIDTTNHIIKGVCLFGRRESDNGYTYQDKAIQKLVQLAEGSKVFLNHPSRSEFKDRDGVRDIRDWAGVYYNPRRNGDKVFADLHAREAFFPLLKDIALMRPDKVGNSINSRVRVFVDEQGKESVVDMDVLHSVDMVASGATIDNLWESTSENIDTETTQVRIEGMSIMEEHLPCLFADIIEGVLADKIKADEIRSKTSRLLWNANDLIYDILHDRESKYKTFTAKKDAVGSVLDDLEKELNKVGKQVKKGESEEVENPLDNITLEPPIPEELMHIELT